jgi:hypothetical protein
LRPRSTEGFPSRGASNGQGIGSGEEFGHSNEDIHKKLLSFGFVAVAYEPQTRNLTELKSYNQNGGNTIYVKDVALISKRCKSAPKRVVHTACDIKI